MRLQDLENRVRVGLCLRGHFRVSIYYRRRTYSTYSTNTLAYDRLRSDISHKSIDCGYTYKQALQALYDFVKRSYHLGEFSEKFYF